MKRMRMVTAFFLSIVTAIGCTAHSFAQENQVSSEIRSGMTYRFLIEKSIAGNDGQKDITPTSSRQVAVLEAGSASAKGIPVKLIVDYPGNVENPSSESAVKTHEWEFDFTITPAGEIADIVALTDEGEIPQPLNRRLLFQRLHELLFVSEYKTGLEEGDRPLVSNTNSTTNTVEVNYSVGGDALEQPPDEDVAEGMVTVREGTAVFDTVARFFVKRTDTEMSRIYVPASDLAAEKVVVLTTTTHYTVTVEGI